MAFHDIPIQKKILRSIFWINGILLLLTCITFLIYELYIFKTTTAEKMSTIGKVIAVNSTAALAFDNPVDAREILSALKTEKHIVAACLYDKNGRLFAQYPATTSLASFPATPGPASHVFTKTNFELFEPVVQDTQQQGTLYLKSDLGSMFERFRLYGLVAGAVITVSFLLAYLLSTTLQKSISGPILALAKTAKRVSEERDYAVRARKEGSNELGVLTDAFNHMLEQIQEQNNHLNEFTQGLEQKVQDRTMELETVNRDLEAFSYSVSHDLRAPLRGIMGFTSMLEDKYNDQWDDEAKRLASRIKQNTIKMNQLINDLLHFSHMSRLDIVKARIDTNSLVKEVVTELDPGSQPITWDIQSLPDSSGDLQTMRQVWINLLSNAIKYSRKAAAPRIEIGASGNGEQVTFFVKDNGVGFDEEYKHKLFKVFQRLHHANDFEGTGVGLAIVEKIISKHGGSIWAEAEKNLGACFYFSLPVNTL